MASPADETAVVETRKELDEHGRDEHQREWTAKYVRITERDEDGDEIPDGAFSSSSGSDVGQVDDLEGFDSEADDPSRFSEFDDEELADMVADGFEVCRSEPIAGLVRKRVRFFEGADDKLDNADGCGESDGGSRGQHCALPEPESR